MVEKKPRRKPRKKAAPIIHVYGDAAHNTAFVIAIGHLVINWANNESIFRAMLTALLREDDPDSHRTEIVWFSLRNTQARLEIVWNLCRAEIKNESLLEDIGKALDHFRSLTDTRHFYCHAMYTYGPNKHLERALGVSLSRDGYPLRLTTKRFDSATLNEMQNVSTNLVKLNKKLWRLVTRLRDELGLPLQELPPQLTEENTNR